ncbi:MAG: trypsin-like peptidase domain-containing protein [Clostridia bacterium]|nr:trypsin-like peptidase domain-containing protein [Clostridia bacterium]
MEDFEKNNTDGEEIKETPGTEDIPSPMPEEENEVEAPEACEEATTEVVTAEPAEPPVEEAPRVYTYSWDYAKPQKKKKNSALIYAIVMTAAFLLAFTTLFVLLIIGALDKTDAAKYPDIPESSVIIEKTENTVYVKEYDPASGVLTTQEAYSKCRPSVVSISVVTTENTAGVGSGFIISEDGYIVTANHVVENTTQVRVILSDGISYPAEIIDGNEFTDIAVIKINATGLTPIKIGKSSDLLVGDNVMAIGTPASLDYAGTLATGHVSYLDRIFKIYKTGTTTIEKKMKLIQTNALVNPGNSGCPLINEYGEAIGIVTMKLNSEYYEGMCFAIPLDAAMPIVNAMIAGEDYDHLLSAVAYAPAVIGIGFSTVNIQSSGEFGLKITSFTASSYDVASKLKLGDIIVKLDGQAFNASGDVSLILDRFAPGDTLNITVYRDGQYMTIPVTLGS